MARVALLIYNKSKDKVFICHNPLRKGETHSFDLPKGHVEDGENLVDAIIREGLEETSHRFLKCDLTLEGKTQYTKDEEITYFSTICQEDEDEFLKRSKCQTLFWKYGKSFPELDYFKWVPVDEIFDYLYLNHQKPLGEVMGWKDQTQHYWIRRL